MSYEINKECFSDFAILKHNGELNVPDDPKNIIGVTVNKEVDSIIVTYPHILQKYKLLKEEPHTSLTLEWRTKHHLTSGVVYDAFGGHYIAVYNRDTVRLNEDIAQFDCSEKYTFRVSIYKILTRINKTPLIIFLNGDCMTLSLGLQQCRTFSRRAVIKESSTILEATCYTRDDTDYVCFIFKDKNNCYNIVNYSLTDAMCDQHKIKIVSVSDSRDSKDKVLHVKGCCIVAGASENPSVCFTWSDTYVGMYNLIKDCWRVKIYPLAIQRQYESILLCLKRNIILFYGRYNDVYDKDNSSYVVTIHKTLPRRWSYGHLRLRPYSKDTKAFDCDDHVVLVEPSRVTVWNITVTGRESTVWCHNDSNALLRWLRPEDIMPIFGPLHKYKYHQNKKSKNNNK